MAFILVFHPLFLLDACLHTLKVKFDSVLEKQSKLTQSRISFVRYIILLALVRFMLGGIQAFGRREIFEFVFLKNEYYGDFWNILKKMMARDAVLLL